MVYNEGVAAKGKRTFERSSTIGQQIRKLRKKRGWSLAELADRIDASPAHLSSIETGRVANPGIELLGRIAKALGASLSITGSDSEEVRRGALAYESPFTVEELQKMGSLEHAAVTKIKEVLKDSRLSHEQRKRIAETLVSMAEWLRNEKLRDDA